MQKAWLRGLVGNPGWTPGCREPGAELASAQALNEEPVQPVGRVQWNPVAGVVDLLVAPGPFHEASRHLHAFDVEIAVVEDTYAKRWSLHGVGAGEATPAGGERGSRGSKFSDAFKASGQDRSET